MAAGLKGSTRSDRLVQKVEASRATIKQIERQLANIPKPPAENDAFDRYAADEFVASNARLLRNLRKQKKMLRKQVKKLKAQAVPKPPKKRPPQGKTDSQYEAYISSPQWAEFRERILEARGRRCEGCGADAKVLHIHHLHYRNFGHEKPEDVCILCVPCHEATHGKKIGRRRKTGTTAGLPAAATHSPELAALSAATA